MAAELGCGRGAVISKLKRLDVVQVVMMLPAEDVAYLDRIAREAQSERGLIVASIVRAVIADDKAAEERAS